MTAQIKRKASVKKEAPAAKHYRLRLREWMMFWILVAFTMILIVTIFEDVNLKIEALSPADTSSQENETLIAQINTLEARVAELQAQLAANATNKQPTPEADCYVANTTDPADSHVYYVDPQTSVSMSLPYSVKWGASGCIPTPIDVTQDAVLFGPNAISGGFLRDASIRIASSTDSNVVLRQLREPESIATSIRQSTVSGMTVISYIEQQLGGDHIWEAFGRSYHYTITSQGWLTDAEAIKIIQSLRVTK